MTVTAGLGKLYGKCQVPDALASTLWVSVRKSRIVAVIALEVRDNLSNYFIFHTMLLHTKVSPIPPLYTMAYNDVRVSLPPRLPITIAGRYGALLIAQIVSMPYVFESSSIFCLLL